MPHGGAIVGSFVRRLLDTTGNDAIEFFFFFGNCLAKHDSFATNGDAADRSLKMMFSCREYISSNF
jgi:hypothetical protein